MLMITVERINKDFILARVTEEDIFCRFMGIDKIMYNKAIYKNNRLRKDEDGSCSFYVNKNSKILYFNDFAWRSFDCFDYVAALFGLEFNQTIYKIAEEFNLFENNNNYVKKPIKTFKDSDFTPRVYDFTFKAWNTKLINYWRKYISWITIEDLNKYNIKPLYTYSIDGIVRYRVSDREIAFIYQLDLYMFQVYAPYKLSNQVKFLTTETKILGLNTVDYNKEYIVIAKSYKDFFLMRLLNINCIGILAEKIRLTVEAQLIVDKFDYKFTIFDNDWTGIRSTIYYKNNYSTIPLLFPKNEPKDFSDNLEKYGERDMWDLINDTASKFSIIL